jgi:hypothetical protein
MRNRLVPLPALALSAALVLVALAGLTAVAAAPAAATPSKSSACTSCHGGTTSGAVSATPNTASPSPGATYAVAVGIGLTASGKTGYHVAQTDAAGAATTWLPVYSGTGTQTSWTATMTAPASLAPGATTVTVTPTGGAASNGLAFTVDAAPPPSSWTAPRRPCCSRPPASARSPSS